MKSRRRQATSVDPEKLEVADNRPDEREAAQIPPGRYDCQVTVVDPAGQKAAFWQAPIAIVP